MIGGSCNFIKLTKNVFSNRKHLLPLIAECKQAVCNHWQQTPTLSKSLIYYKLCGTRVVGNYAYLKKKSNQKHKNVYSILTATVALTAPDGIVWFDYMLHRPAIQRCFVHGRDVFPGACTDTQRYTGGVS